MTGHNFFGAFAMFWRALFASFASFLSSILHFTSTPPHPSPRPSSASQSSPHSQRPIERNPIHSDPRADLEQGLAPDRQDMSSGRGRGSGGARRGRGSFRGGAFGLGSDSHDHPRFHYQNNNDNLNNTLPRQDSRENRRGRGSSNAAHHHGHRHPSVISKNPFATLAACLDNQDSDTSSPKPSDQKYNSFRALGRKANRKSFVNHNKSNKENVVPSLDSHGPTPISTTATAHGHGEKISDIRFKPVALLTDETSSLSSKQVHSKQNGNEESLVYSMNRLATSEGGVVAKDLAKVEAKVEAAVESTAAPLPADRHHEPVVPASKPDALPTPILPGMIEPHTPEEKAERQYHLKYMNEALDMGRLALVTNETPVGCVLVYNDKVIAKGMNATNVTRNGTRHAEFMAISALLSFTAPEDVRDDTTYGDAHWSDVDPSDGHLYPYGQKLHPAPLVSRSVISECILYVTVEPCVMCASLLRQLGIKKVYFGAVNDKFGGTGGVFRIHQNSQPTAMPQNRPYQSGYGPQDSERIFRGRATVPPRDEGDGDGGNVEQGYPVEGGYMRDEAVSLLRRFYVQENGRAPQPRKKEGRAARLFAMENQANAGSSSDISDAAQAAEKTTTGGGGGATGPVGSSAFGQ